MSRKWLWTIVVSALAIALPTACARLNFFAGNFVPVAAPAFSISPGAYAQPLRVAITDSNPGLTIRYTTDPTANVSDQAAWSLYSRPISVSTTTNLRAYGYANPNNLSRIISGVYSIGGLINLVPSVGTLLPAFTPLDYEYTDIADASSVSVTPTSAVPGQAIAVDGAPVASGSASSSIALSPGQNIIMVTTSGGAGTPAYTYSLVAVKGSEVSGEILNSKLNLPNASSTQVTTLTTGLGVVRGLATDGHYLYFASFSGYYIGRIDLTNPGSPPTVVAGDPGVQGESDGVGAASRWMGPWGLALNAADTTLYATDYPGNRAGLIREINLSNLQVTTIAGSATVAGSTNGPGASATFSAPEALAAIGSSLYVADYYNGVVREVDLSSSSFTVSTPIPMPTYSAGCPYGPTGITTNGSSLFVTLGHDAPCYTSDGDAIWEVPSPPSPSGGFVLAGHLGTAGSADGSPGANAYFNVPQNATTDGTSVYVTEYPNDVRSVAISNGATVTIAGTQGTGGGANGTGTVATFGNLWAATTDGLHLYVADGSNGDIRVLSP